MKTKLTYALAFLLSFQTAVHAQELRGKIERSVLELKTIFPQIPKDKVLNLDQLATKIAAKMGEANHTVVVVDKTNDNVSQFAMIWLRTGLLHYGLDDNLTLESAGVESVNSALDLTMLRKYGFRVKNVKDKELFTYEIQYGTNSWEIKRKSLESLNLRADNSTKIFVEENLNENNETDIFEVIFQNKEVIPGEMLYVATRINTILETKL
ncbi:hypothetical protein [Ulvibacterium sp.]|uniref:hypothetical protein n=1 Tax=Ulvibacterium sp. TaxID=2665914 RepID=UPI003CC53D47